MRMTWIMMLAASSVAAPAAIAADTAHASAPITPADRLEQLDRFRDGLSHADRQRLDKALPRSTHGGIARCDNAEGSRASCEAAAYMHALRSTGLMHRFLATASPMPR